MTTIRAGLIVAAGLLLHAFDAGAQDVTLATSSPCYAPGETVSFSLTNSRDAAIYMSHSPVWDLFETATGSYVAPSPIFHTVVSFDGHRSATYTWNQRNYEGIAVGEGEYRVEVAYSVLFNPWVSTTIATTFEISGSCHTTGVDHIRWDRFKNLFR